MSKYRNIEYKRIGETIYALFHDKALLSLKISRYKNTPRLGQVYCAIIGDVDIRLSSAFINLGFEKFGFLPFSGKRPEYLKKGNKVLVRVINEGDEDKGARLAFFGEAKTSEEAPRLYEDAPPFHPWPEPFEATNEEIEIIEQKLEDAKETIIAIEGGGHISIEKTKALTAIDIDGGARNYNGQNPINFKSKLNQAALKSIISQILLRNIGGIIIIDFAGTPFGDDAKNLVKALNEGLKAHNQYLPNKSEVFNISRLGLCEISRQRFGQSLNDATIDKIENDAITAINEMAKALRTAKGKTIKLMANAQIIKYLENAPFDWKNYINQKIGGIYEIIEQEKEGFYLI